MPFEYLSITSSVLVVLGYLPEIYFVIKNKKSNITNIPIWIIWLVSSGLGIIYCGLNNYYLIMINYLLNFFLSLITFLLNMFFLYCNKKEEISIGEISISEISIGEISIGEISISEISIGEISIGEIFISEKEQICDNV